MLSKLLGQKPEPSFAEKVADTTTNAIKATVNVVNPINLAFIAGKGAKLASKLGNAVAKEFKDGLGKD